MQQCRLLMKMYAFVRSNVPRALGYTDVERKKSLTRKESERIPAVIKEDENENSQALLQSAVALKKRINGTKNCEVEFATSVQQMEKVEISTTTITKKIRSLGKKDSWIFWDDEDQNTPCPSYSKYLYFYFAPTLIYKDAYPRLVSNVLYSFQFLR
jgi:hypothetical protein